MLTVNPYYPHPPFDPPKAYRDRYDPELLPGPHFRPGDLEQQAALAAIDFQSVARSPETGREAAADNTEAHAEKIRTEWLRRSIGPEV